LVGPGCISAVLVSSVVLSVRFHQCGFISRFISGFVSAGFISGFVSAGFISGFIHVVSSVRFHQWFYQCGFISGFSAMLSEQIQSELFHAASSSDISLMVD
jgi:hypothetical protein